MMLGAGDKVSDPYFTRRRTMPRVNENAPVLAYAAAMNSVRPARCQALNRPRGFRGMWIQGQRKDGFVGSGHLISDPTNSIAGRTTIGSSARRETHRQAVDLSGGLR